MPARIIQTRIRPMRPDFCLFPSPIPLRMTPAQDQKQPQRLWSKILLPPLWTHSNCSWSKAAKAPQVAGFCCFRLRPILIALGQRQQKRLKLLDFAASALVPLKSLLTIGSKNASSCWILLPLPCVPGNLPRPKAAIMPWMQDFAASALIP